MTGNLLMHFTTMFTTFTCQSTSLTRPLRSKYTVHEGKKKLIIVIIFPKKKGKRKKREKRKCQSLTFVSVGFRGGFEGVVGGGGGGLAQYLHM